ncbi:MAG: TonB-dependent receptor domain-containing protein, partial [Steroidobacteraceae bacterium]
MEGKQVPAISGEMSSDEALSRLLAATGLVVVSRQADTIVLGDPNIGSSRAEMLILEEVIVTAQKRVENVRDIPASISVLGGTQLENLHATNLLDYAAYVPGLAITPGGSPGKVALSLRGLSPLSDAATVGTYIDDAPLGSSGSWGRSVGLALDLLPYDVERIEVLRGPQGTLYGVNTLGGLLKYVMRSPDPSRFEARVGAEASTIEGAGDTGWGARASVNIPLVDNALALRASYFNQHTPGYISVVPTGRRDANTARQEGGRLGLLWQATDDLSIKLSSVLQNIESGEDSIVSLDATTLAPLQGQLTSAFLFPQVFRQQLRFHSANVTWDLGGAEFVSVSSYARTTTRDDSDLSASFGSLVPLFCGFTPECAPENAAAPGLSPFFVNLEFEKYTQEFRLASPAGGRIEWLLGAFYTDEDSRNLQLLTAFDRNGAPVAPLNPLVAASVPTTYREYAGFGNLTYRFTDAFDVTGGVRWARNSQRFRQITAGPLLPQGDVPGRSAENVYTYLLSPRYRVNEDTMVYARIATGYRPGGPNLALPGIPPQVDADTIVNYELGLKSELLGRRLLLDVAIYHIDWRDIQITSTNEQGIGFFENASTARSRGIELTSAYSPVRGLRLGLNAAYTDAIITEDAPSLGGVSGDRLPGVPKWGGALTADYEFNVRGNWNGRLGGAYRYVGDAFAGVEGSGALLGEAYGIADFFASVF